MSKPYALKSDPRLMDEQVRILYMQAPISNLTVIGISIIYFLFLQERIGSVPIGLWAASLSLMAVYRLALWYGYRADPAKWQARQWLRKYAVACGLVGLAWSPIYLLQYFNDELVVSITVFMLFFGVVGSAVSILSTSLTAFVVYTFPQALMLGLALILYEDRGYDYAIAALFVYMLMMLLFTKNANEKILQMIALQQQNSGLVEQLECEVEQREVLVEQRTRELRVANRELEKEVGERMKAQEDADFQYSLLRSVLNSTPDLIFYKDYRTQDGRYMGCNRAFSEFAGKSVDDIVGKNDLELFGDETGVFFRKMDRRILDSGEARVNEECVGYPDGQKVLLSTLKTPFYNQERKLLGVLGVSRDITEKKQAEDKLAEERSFLQTVIDGIGDPVLVIGRDFELKLSNRAAKHRLDGEAASASLKCHQVSHGRQQPCETAGYPCPLSKVLATGESTTVIHRDVALSKRVETHELIATPLWSDDGEAIGIIEAYRDITDHLRVQDELRSKEASLKYIAHHDVLTNLPNRLLFVDRLDHALRISRRDSRGLALLFIDLDHFKEINDSLGHTVGDQLLQAVSERLGGQVREDDTVARLGGDEFIVIMERLPSAAAASHLAEKLIKAFHAPFSIGDYELSITVSIGISLYPEDGRSTETLLRNADAAMYQAKAEGRNSFKYYQAEMTSRAVERVVMEGALRNAIRLGQLRVYYQPQVELTTGKVIGAEALIRWQHPEKGLLLPGRFVPLAEDSGQIEEIGTWVLRTVCANQARWRSAGRPRTPIAVNLSGRQVVRRSIVDMVREVLAETDCDADWIELEITEGFIMRHPVKTIAELQGLKDLGIRIAIDDFGTGYSSLSYLKRLPISKLKIDRSFVCDIVSDPNDQAISRAIIALGKSLGLRTIAEGIEDRQQADILIREGCDEAQGFYYSHPLPEAQFEAFLARHA